MYIYRRIRFNGATLKACHPCALRADAQLPRPDIPHQRMIGQVLNDADAYDVILFHVGWFEFPLFASLTHKCITTLHGRLDVPSAWERLSQSPDFPLVSISNAQRLPLPHLAWQGTIYHGLPEALMPEPDVERDYVVFLGRISPEKRPDLAIDIARRAEVPRSGSQQKSIVRIWNTMKLSSDLCLICPE